jgi:hypothetical protein
MDRKKIVLVLFFQLLGLIVAGAQSTNIQKGCVLEKDKNLRLSKILVKNKRNGAIVQTDLHGLFSIKVVAGDTLEFTGDYFTAADMVVSDFADAFVYMRPGNQLNEVVIRESSQIRELKQTLNEYRVLGVFYLRNPRYYYAVCKPFSFIYENFKGEMIEARRFNRYTAQAISSLQVSERYNETFIKSVIPTLSSSDLIDFMNAYRPTLTQLNSWNNYALIEYILNSYHDYQQNKTAIKSRVEIQTHCC